MNKKKLLLLVLLIPKFWFLTAKNYPHKNKFFVESDIISNNNLLPIYPIGIKLTSWGAAIRPRPAKRWEHSVKLAAFCAKFWARFACDAGA